MSRHHCANILLAAGFLTQIFNYKSRVPSHHMFLKFESKVNEECNHRPTK